MAAIGLTCEITGDEELDKELAAIIAEDGPKSLNAQIRKECRAAVNEIVKPAVLSLVPWDFGTLESKIVVRAGKRERNKISYWVGFPDKLFTGETYYGGFIEFGTKVRKKKSTGQVVGYVKADSFLRRALYPNANQIIEQVRQRLAAWVDQRNQAAA